ncbi:MAG: hypothetical protein FJ279_12015 [Planctomycetes bacterium]|nr:hypothetical protein [Planctomycetota bacterium]
MRSHVLSVAVTVVAVSLAVTHMISPRLTIDGVTGLLLVVAALPWVRRIFKSVELPGGLKVELQDSEETKDNVANTAQPLDKPK